MPSPSRRKRGDGLHDAGLQLSKRVAPLTPAARIAAAIEILADIAARRRPAAEAIKDWGHSHRFAGSGDRSAIAGAIFDALRKKSSSAFVMQDESARAVVLGAMIQRDADLSKLEFQFSGVGHGPAILSDAERGRLTAYLANRELAAPDWVRGDYPEWLAPAFAASFGAAAAREGQALAARAPVDLRVNLLKGDRAGAMAALSHLSPAPTPHSPWGLRINVREDGKGVALAAEPAYVRGLVEVQDEGSQLAALLCGAKPGDQLLDLCAGAGGKALALAAIMGNQGQIYATDPDGRRLMPIFARVERAGARNVQVRAPRGAEDILADLRGRCDIVLVDAPCSGSGAWRRNPDAKWRMRPGALDQRLKDQADALQQATRYVKQGGRIVYVTCSVLRAENEERIAAFLESAPDFLPLDAAHMSRAAGAPALAAFASKFGPGLRLSPLQSQTDGFYVAALTKS